MATTISFPRTTTSSRLQKTLRLCVSSCARRKQHAKRATAAPPGRAVVAERKVDRDWSRDAPVPRLEGEPSPSCAYAVVAGVPPARFENCSRHGCLYRSCRFNALGTTLPPSLQEARALS